MKSHIAVILCAIQAHLSFAGVPVCRAVQAPGEFIVTFPRGYHAGFSNGFCVGEAANFATGNWFSSSAEACQRYCRLQHPIMFSQEYLLCAEARALACEHFFLLLLLSVLSHLFPTSEVLEFHAKLTSHLCSECIASTCSMTTRLSEEGARLFCARMCVCVCVCVCVVVCVCVCVCVCVLGGGV